MAEIQTGGGAFIVELDRFHGPLDLLLHLIREQDIDIFDIPIARITEQFLRAIEGIEVLELAHAGEFLEMAATLVRIKAQMLLPRRDGDEEEEDDPRAELVRRLLEYEHFREAARELEAREGERMRHHARGYVPPLPEPDAAERPLETTWDELWEAALGLADRNREPRDHRVLGRRVTVEEKVVLILDSLRRLARVEFRRLVAPFRERAHAVATLLAGLELARTREIRMRQREPFAALWLYARNGSDAGKAEDGDDADR
ncbi:MAG: segregation and condensation protein A [Gemmatimonadota bacterium]